MLGDTSKVLKAFQSAGYQVVQDEIEVDCEGLEKKSNVKQVGLADRIGSGDAVKGAEVEINVDQVLEAVDSEAGQHGRSPFGLAT